MSGRHAELRQRRYQLNEICRLQAAQRYAGEACTDCMIDGQVVRQPELELLKIETKLWRIEHDRT